MSCQRCGSDRILNAGGKSGDLNSASFKGRDLNEHYVVGGCNVGGGDYYRFSVCLECGQLQGTWPVSDPNEELRCCDCDRPLNDFGECKNEDCCEYQPDEEDE